jgi:hypothetical protein
MQLRSPRSCADTRRRKGRIGNTEYGIWNTEYWIQEAAEQRSHCGHKDLSIKPVRLTSKIGETFAPLPFPGCPDPVFRVPCSVFRGEFFWDTIAPDDSQT